MSVITRTSRVQKNFKAGQIKVSITQFESPMAAKILKKKETTKTIFKRMPSVFLRLQQTRFILAIQTRRIVISDGKLLVAVKMHRKKIRFC